ncbi:PrgI family protein [bacterium]|nr:PrgI family protein [bacterium]
MLYKVPQNINLEDKVIGPLTFRQFIYLLVGGIPSFVIIKLLEKAGVNLFFGAFLTLPIWVPCILLAFGKYQEENLDAVLVAWLTFVFKPKKMIWQRGKHLSRVKVLRPKKKKIVLPEQISLESRLQRLNEEVGIYGLSPQEKKERIAQSPGKLKIKTKIKPLRILPSAEKKFVPQSFLQTFSGVRKKERRSDKITRR